MRYKLSCVYRWGVLIYPSGGKQSFVTLIDGYKFLHLEEHLEETLHGLVTYICISIYRGRPLKTLKISLSK